MKGKKGIKGIKGKKGKKQATTIEMASFCSKLMTTVVLFCLHCNAHAFLTPSYRRGVTTTTTYNKNKNDNNNIYSGHYNGNTLLHGTASNTEQSNGGALLEEIRSMRVKEIKAELSKLNVSTQDVFEKEELVQRLLEVRQNGKKLEDFRTSTSTASTSSSSSSFSSSAIIKVPLYFTNLDANMKVAAVNMNGGGISVEPSDQPYATIEVTVHDNSNSNKNAPFTLRLLLDTACSGFVLRPSVVNKYNLPKMSTPVTMTGAGGTTGATGLTQLAKFSVGTNSETFGPMPAAVQDIGALPASLDGIIGLSFLSQFNCVDMDFSTGQLTLYKRGSEHPPPAPVGKVLVSQGNMDLIPQLGIYTVDVTLGTRGPVKMLVDTGAANTFLNWNGVSNLGISRQDNTFLQRLSNPMGAMGSDNIAMQLTHRINVSSVLKLGRSASTSLQPGLSLKDSRRLRIDIGDIAILDSLRGQNVGGILGIDALMRSSCVRLIFNGGQKEIQLYDN